MGSRLPGKLVGALFLVLTYARVLVCSRGALVCICMQRPVVHLRCHPFLRSHLLCLPRQGLSLVWDSLVRLGWLTSKPQGPTCLCSPTLGLQAHSTMPEFFYVVSGDGTRVLVWQSPYWRGYLPNPKNCAFKCARDLLTPRLPVLIKEGYAVTRRGDSGGELCFLITCSATLSYEECLDMRHIKLTHFCCWKNPKYYPSNFQGCIQIRHSKIYLLKEIS